MNTFNKNLPNSVQVASQTQQPPAPIDFSEHLLRQETETYLRFCRLNTMLSDIIKNLSDFDDSNALFIASQKVELLQELANYWMEEEAEAMDRTKKRLANEAKNNQQIH